MNDFYQQQLKIVWDFLVSDNQPAQPVDIVILPGSLQTGSAQVAADYYNKQYTQKIITTGGRVEKDNKPVNKFLNVDDKQHTEAKFFSGLLQEYGVPETAIWLEEQAANSFENFSFVKKVLDQADAAYNNIAVACGPFAMKRFKATAGKFFDSSKIVCTTFTDNYEDYLAMNNSVGQPYYDLQGLAGVCAGEVERLDFFGNKGDCLKVDIPENVISAKEHLRLFNPDGRRLVK